MQPEIIDLVCRRTRLRSGGAARRRPRLITMGALGVALAALSLLAGCRSGGVAAVRAASPDHVWVAVARTGPPGWFFSKRQETIVTLECHKQRSNPVDSLWKREPWLPVTVLRMTHRAPFPLGGELVRLRWLTPTHLEVAYGGDTRVDYHLQNCSGIHILVEELGEASGEEMPNHAMPSGEMPDDAVHRHLH
jgi:hypothetical protein